jgi:serine/threonine protein kinase
LAKGGELMDYITTRIKLAEKEGRKFFRQIVSGLAHIHAANVVHRDLKLENILLSKDMDCLITDFGLGSSFEASSYGMKVFYYLITRLFAVPRTMLQQNWWLEYLTMESSLIFGL